MKKGKNIVGYIITFLSLFLCLYIAIEVIIANNEGRPPRVFSYSVSYVPTDSMTPAIEPGDYILFQSTSFDKLNVDDIVVYKANDGRFIVHRVIEKANDYLVVKGDNNPIADTERVTEAMIYGKYISTLGFMSIFSGGINKNLIFFILVIIFIIMIVMQVISLLVKDKTDKLKKSREDEMKLLREELKKEILEEELKRLREEKENKK